MGIDSKTNVRVKKSSYRDSVEANLETQSTSNGKQFRSVKIDSLGNRRRGKHHDLMGGILQQLKTLKAGLALEIPLEQVNGVELANLCSAVHRAAEAEKLTVQTQSDDKNFYVWRTQ